MVCNFNTNCTTDECSDDVTDINTCDCNDKNIILTESGLLPMNFTDFYICSTHFNELLKRNSDLRRRKVCQLPTLISAHPPVASHSVVGVKKPKPSRNINITDVEKIQKCYGLTLPNGTPACTSCLIKISKQSTEIEAESLDQGKCEDDQIQQCSNLDTDDETYLMETDQLDVLTEKENICDNLIEISASEYTVTSEESGSQNYLSQSQQSVRSYERCSCLTSLNDFLSSVRLQEFSEKERKTWRSYTFKTRNTYKERFDEIMKLIIEILFPNDVDEVIDDIKCPKQLNEENRTIHTEYKDIVTSYRKTESWQQGRQVLSVLASRMSFKDLLSLLPEVTSHRYYAALSHSKKIVPALPIPEKKLHRQKLDPERLDAFLDFITSSHVVRDLPFGGKKLKFSDGTVHNLPNVVRCMGSADIIQQYKAYCQENEISLLGDSTMFKILAQCGAKVRKSLEGLDYFVAEGGRAFITFQDVLDKLLTYDAISPDDHKSFQALFLQSKQYLRTDYKIHISKGREVADHCMLYGYFIKQFKKWEGTIKSSIRRYVNQGHDVLTAQSMKKAIDKSAKIVKYIVRVIEGTECRKTKYTAIPAISTYSNFTFSAHGITAWKAYQVGTGKLIPSSDIPSVEKCILNTSCPEIEGEIDVVFHQLPLKAEKEENTITCANEGFTLSFSSFHDLSSHLMFGKCEFEFRCQFSNGCDITKKT
ncbi:uncharacterized protein LOC134719265 [Mytilus trossulus]|uniref:uncharacterized protein LOC134719265 n=1 Tax=Mytilus trossulus TaxID=6551 RepID=UPI00300583D9